MKRNVFFRGIVITMLSIFLLNITAFAQSNNLLSSEYISNTDVSITAEAKGKLIISFSIRATDIMTQIGATSIVVYENSGNGFTPVKTFRYTDEGYSGMIINGSMSHGGEVYYTGTVGYKYYAVVSMKAADQYGGDTFSQTTATVTAKKN